MNPCLDCRAYMLAKAAEYLKTSGADFVFTGEVLGQRPMSQYRRALATVAKESGLEDLLLRPLSAKLLPPTLPEREGWVDRERLLGISGRSRKVQMEEAEKRGLDLDDIPQPAGGCCFLTDEAYSRKLRDYLDHMAEDRPATEVFLLLKVGRHLRLGPDVKLIVGRDEAENAFLANHRPGRWEFWTPDVPGATVLVEARRELTDDEIRAISEITARYSRGRDDAEVRVCRRAPGGAGETLGEVEDRPAAEAVVPPASLDVIDPLRV
jgi:tRNA U34 2-thiouridine synthase MnmA/TrmU